MSALSICSDTNQGFTDRNFVCGVRDCNGVFSVVHVCDRDVL